GTTCQGFSIAGPRKEDDDRNILYKSMVETARKIRPKVIVLENVPGLLTLYEGKAAKRINEDFETLGYQMESRILYAPEYGIPQIRKRVFFVGVQEGIKFEFPKPIIEDKVNYITTEDAISDLPSREHEIGLEVDEYDKAPMTEYQREMRKNAGKLYNHVGANHIEKTINLISMVPEGKNYKSLPEKYRNQFKYNE